MPNKRMANNRMPMPLCLINEFIGIIKIVQVGLRMHILHFHQILSGQRIELLMNQRPLFCIFLHRKPIGMTNIITSHRHSN